MDVKTKENVLKTKSFQFAIRIVKLFKYLASESHEYVLSKQILRSGTSIGALARESEHAESKKDFIHKLTIALKEANETYYWIELFFASQLIPENIFESMLMDCNELISILVASIKTSKLRL
jgi:four helix bundle protein